MLKYKKKLVKSTPKNILNRNKSPDQIIKNKKTYTGQLLRIRSPVMDRDKT